MDGIIEAVYIYDELNNPVLTHTYTARSLSSSTLLAHYLEHPKPQPSLLYLPDTNPPTLLFSLVHGGLLFLLTTSSEVEPLLILEFLHRIADAFEDFLGAPLIAGKIESNYDVAAQLLNEMCDAGTISTTEPNALRDLVEVEGLVGRLLGSISLPGKASGFGNTAGAPSVSLLAQNMPAVPWRRANVKHVSNEMYADVVETLNVTLAPSGRPIAAFANGTIAFTSKVSGLPDVVLSLTGPSGKHNLASLMELPVFHPCVRLARWKQNPGELSFVPPDGRFILAGYEADLLPFSNGKSGSLNANNLKLPVNIEVKTGIGATGSEFEVRLHINKMFSIGASTGGASGRSGGGGLGRGFGGPTSGSSGAPLLEDVRVTIPLPADVRNLPDIRPSKGDATYNPGARFLEWHIPSKDLGGAGYFGLRCTVAGASAMEDERESADPTGFGFNEYAYDEPYQAAQSESSKDKSRTEGSADTEEDKAAKKMAQNKILMPSSASVSFSVKGWLPSGIKVESIVLDMKKSRGIGEGVKPYKGVKYLTVSKGGVEIRC